MLLSQLNAIAQSILDFPTRRIINTADFSPPSILSQLSDHLLYFLQNLAGLHQPLHRVVVVIQWTVHFEMLYVFADYLARLVCSFAGRELAEVQRLGGGHEFDPQNTIGVVEDLSILEGGVHAHRNEILLICRGRDGLNACGRG